jgi:hypothetical protein
MRAIERMGLFLFVYLLLLGCPAYGQSSGATASATGVVRDEQGAVIPGANVALRELSTNLTREALSGEDGSFLILQLPPGEYEASVMAEGFNPKLLKATLTVGTTLLINFTLSAGPVSLTVEVTAEAGGVSVEGRTERATNIATDEITRLPINRRDFLDFTLTTPGATPDRVSATGAAATSGLSFNGQSARQNNITIDGVDNNDPGNGTARSTFSQDAVQEFQVVGANYSAEFGRAAGGVINIVTKGGTNEYHGSLFNFTRNDSISARDAFSPFKPEFRQYQFGATFGGPLKKERAFFFLSFERLSVKQNNIVTISDQLVSSAKKLNIVASNGPVPFSEDSTRLLYRGDFQVNPNDRLTVRYNYAGVYNGALQTFGGLRDSSAAGILNLNDNTIAISNTLISPGLNLINETRFLFTRRDQDITPVDQLGPSINLFTPGGLVNIGRDPLLPQMSLSRFFNIVDNVSISRGRHQVKTGFDFLFFRVPDGKITIPVLFGGLAVFLPVDFSQVLGIPGLPTFSAEQFFDPDLRTPQQQMFLNLASALLPRMFPGFPEGVPLTNLPIPFAFLQGFGNPRSSVGYDYYSAYVQDDFRLRPNLLIKAGLRYDQERIRFAPKNSGNLSPRVSFFYRPANKERLSLFGSYGIFHGTIQHAAATVTKFLDGKTVVTPLLPFPFSILAFSLPGHHFPESGSLPPQLPFIPQLARDTLISPSLRSGYAQEANFGVNYLINSSAGFSASYQMVRGLKVFLARNINPVVRPVANNPILGQITGRVDPTRGELISFETSGDSYYNAATVSFFARSPRRFSLLAHYTFSKAIDNYVDALRVDINELQDPLNLRGERGLSLQDVRSRFVLSGTWDTGSGRNQLIRNFEISTIISINSGQPFNLLAGVDLNGNGDSAAPADRPNGIGRNAGRGPGFASFDMRIARKLVFGERLSLTGYFEAFNLFNRLNISDFNRVFPPRPDGSFDLPPMEDGRFIVTRDRFAAAFRPRQLQLGFRLTF